MLVPEISAAQVLSAFLRDAPYLFLGSAFVALGIISAAFSGLRRKRDPLLLYLAVYAILYGLRMWIRSDMLAMSIHRSWFYVRLRFATNYIVPIPAILFFNAAGFFSRVGKIAGNILILLSCLFSVVSVIWGPSDMMDRVNSIVVIVAIIALMLQTKPSTASEDFATVRGGLMVLAAFVIWDNLRGVFQYSFPDLEPFGFAVFLGSMGYVAARRSLQREQDLSKIHEELDVARRIQTSILPAEFPASPHFRVCARYLPMTSVAGDFYDYVLAGPEQAGLLIADVSGHGVPAALIASMVKLAAASQRTHVSDPAAFLSQMNSTLFGNTQNQFVTAAYVHLDSEAKEFRYSAAGHPPMLLLRKGEITQVEENGLILAAFDFAQYSTAISRLETGDRLLLYTDGLIESANAAGDAFGIEGLSEVFKTTARNSASEAADHIVAKVQSWSKTQEDDLTVLVCDYIG